MDSRKTAKRERRRFAPNWEGLEGRDLPSTTALIATGSLLATSRATADAGGASSPGSPISIPLLFRPFVAKFQGSLVVGPPRNAGLVSQTYMFGGGNSSAFLHGDLQLAYFTPKDSSQPVIGQAVMIVKNVSNTGNELIVDLTAVPGAVDHHGRPTRFTWTQNPASGGIFTNGDGSGTAQFIYSPGRFPGQSNLHQAISGGHVGVIFRGTLGTTNLTSTLRNQ
jgi:hypothetical protein